MIKIDGFRTSVGTVDSGTQHGTGKKKQSTATQAGLNSFKTGPDDFGTLYSIRYTQTPKKNIFSRVNPAQAPSGSNHHNGGQPQPDLSPYPTNKL